MTNRRSAALRRACDERWGWATWRSLPAMALVVGVILLVVTPSPKVSAQEPSDAEPTAITAS